MNEHYDPTGYAPVSPVEDPPNGYAQPETRVAALRQALAGVPLGRYDLRIVHWLAGWDDSTARTVVSLLHRARQAGRGEWTLTAAQAETARQAIADACQWRDPAGGLGCGDCLELSVQHDEPRMCDDHQADHDAVLSYRQLDAVLDARQVKLW
ncbi:MAG TPA: hypothetical protein VLW50_30520 [Streptosporangiaceae bacterium]|nr:hypothetical protein [Streptosporangiaceae bacterium]